MTDYSRQPVLDQGKIANAKIVIAGSSAIAHFFCLYASGLGLGYIRLIDGSLIDGNNNEFLWGRKIFRFLKKQSKASAVKQKISEINPDVCLDAVNLNLEKSLLCNTQIVLDFTNLAYSKSVCLEHAISNKVPMISCSSSETNASISCFNPKSMSSRLFKDAMLLEDYCSNEQGNFTSAIIAAIALDETRKTVAPMQDDRLISGRLNYNLNSGFSLNKQKDHKLKRPKKVLVIGAGGIGTYASLCLGLSGSDFEIYDGDVVESSNLNRQVFYTSHLGENKALSLKRELDKISYADITAYPKYFSEKDFSSQHSMVLCCVDSWEAREFVNRKCVKNNIPLINGSVTAFSARVETYAPKESCLACKYEFDELIKLQSSRTSCNAVQESNIVMANAMAGAMMAAESTAISSSKDFEYFSNPGLRGRFRAVERPQKDKCVCRRKKWWF